MPLSTALKYVFCVPLPFPPFVKCFSSTLLLKPLIFLILSKLLSPYYINIRDKDIKEYIATKEPMDKAGSYAIQGKCAAYIKGICGDYNNVVGLPVARLMQEIFKLGIVL